MYKFLTFEVALKVRAAPFFPVFWCVCAKFCAVGNFFLNTNILLKCSFFFEKKFVKNGDILN